LAQPPFFSDATTGSRTAEPILDFPFLGALNKALAGFVPMIPGLKVSKLDGAVSGGSAISATDLGLFLVGERKSDGQGLFFFSLW
jgi:hypothetical protein